MVWTEHHDCLSLRARPDTDARTSSPSYRHQPFAVEGHYPEGICSEADHRGVGSLVGELSITESGAGVRPVLFGYPFDKLASKLRHAPRDEDHRIADVEIANLTALIEAPPVSGGSRKAHLASLRDPNITSCRHDLSIQGESDICLVGLISARGCPLRPGGGMGTSGLFSEARKSHNVSCGAEISLIEPVRDSPSSANDDSD